MGIESSTTQTNCIAETFPLNTHEAFLAHVGNLRKNRQLFGRVAKTVPEQLLVVSKHVWPKPIPATTITRTYFGLSIMNERHSEFRSLAEAEFCILHDVCHPTHLTLYGEPPKQYSTRPRDIILLGLWQHHQTCNPIFLGASVDEHHLILQYNNTGSIERIDPFGSLCEIPVKYFGGWSKNLLATTGGLPALLQEDSIAVKINNRYSYLLSSDSQLMAINQLIRQHPGDGLTTPLQVNPEYIISRLFHPETIEDPVNAPPELDKSWRSANILRVLGIEWSRY